MTISKDLFLLDPEVVFLNHGSFGACPRQVFQVYQDWQCELERQPVEFLGRRITVLLAEARLHLGLAFDPHSPAGSASAPATLPLASST